MLLSSKPRKIGVLALLILTSLGTATAVQPDIQIDPVDKVIWTNDGGSSDQVDHTLNADISCESSDGNQDIEYVALRGPDYLTSKFAEDDSGDISASNHSYKELLDDQETGKYWIEAKCKNGDTSRKTFYIDRLEIEISKPEDGSELHIGTEENFEIDISSVEDRVDMDNFGELKLFVGNTEIPPKEFQLREDTSVNAFVKEEVIDEDKQSEDKNLRVEVPYNQKDEVYFQVNDEIDVKATRWEVKGTEFSPDQRIPMKELSQLSLKTSIKYQGDPINKIDESFSPSSFYLEGKDNAGKEDYNWFSGSLEDESQGRYSLKLEKMPTLEEVKVHKLDVVFNNSLTSEDDSVHIGTVYVDNKFDFEGQVSDSDGRAISTTFRVSESDYFKEFSTNSNGEFDERLVPGNEYTVDIQFPQTDLSLSNVELEGDYSGNVNYEYISTPSSLDLDIEGVRAIDMMAVSFGYPFEKGTVKMNYDSGETEDPLEVKVFECTNWNFWAQECISDWEEIPEDDIRRNPTNWYAEFPVNPVQTDEFDGEQKNVLLNAYAVGTNSQLGLNNEIRVQGPEAGRIPVGEDVTVSGRVVSQQEFISGVDVEASFVYGGDEEKTLTGTTDSEGRFELEGEAPTEPGNYTVKISLSKDPYKSFETEFENSFETYLKEGIDVEVPSSDNTVNVNLGEKSNTDITVSNLGQTELTDVNLVLEGLDAEYYSLSPTYYDTISEGGERTVTLSIQIPESYCPDGSCDSYPRFTISADAQSKNGPVEDQETVFTRIIRSGETGSSSDSNESASTQESSQTDRNQGGSSFNPREISDATGEFLASQSSMNIALGLIMIFTMVLAGAIKKKKDDDAGRRGGNRPVSMGAGGAAGGAAGAGNANVQKPKVASTDQESQEAEQNPQPQQSVEQEDSSGDVSGTIDKFASKLTGGDDEGEEVEEEIEEVAEEIEHEEEDTTGEEVEAETEEVEEEATSDQEADEEEGSEHSCSVCGEEFDTESARKLHLKAIHDEE